MVISLRTFFDSFPSADGFPGRRRLKRVPMRLFSSFSDTSLSRLRATGEMFSVFFRHHIDELIQSHIE